VPDAVVRIEVACASLVLDSRGEGSDLPTLLVHHTYAP
jgi:hypothetical protein